MYGEPDLGLHVAIDEWLAEHRAELEAKGFQIERRGVTEAEWEGNHTAIVDVKHPNGEGTLICWAKGDCDTELWRYTNDEITLNWHEINSREDMVAVVEKFFAAFGDQKGV
jgi:hypothetical protein